MQQVIKTIKDCVASKTCCEETGVDCNQGRACPVREGTHKPAEAVHQIQEPAPATAMDALREAEAALEVAIARILKADPGHSISVTSEAKALVAVRAALAAPAAVAVPGDMRAVLSAAVEQMECDALMIEMEWGTGRNLHGLSIDGDLPPALLQARAALAATSVQDVVLPEPDAAIKDVMELVQSCIDRAVTMHTVPTLGINTIESKLRALLATCGQAQAVASIYVTEDGRRECDDWKVPLPVGRNLLYAAPQAQAGAREANVQWWLADIDQYGNPALTDGAHSDRAGADKAAYLINAMGLGQGRKFAVARVELSDPKPSAEDVNHEAIAQNNRAAISAAQGGE